MSTARLSLILNLLLAIVCAVLLQQNRALKQGAGHSAGGLRPGSHVSAFAYHTLGGRPAVLAFDDPDKRMLLFVLSTTCPWCEKSLPQIRSIVRAVNPARITPLGVSIHGAGETASFVVNQHIDFELVCADSSEQFQRDLRIDGVPTTLLISGRGVVLNVWEGEITPTMADEIRRAAAHS